MKKILIIIMFLSIICLSSCQKTYSEEDKVKYHEHFKSIDDIEEYKYVFYSIFYTVDSINYRYIYSCRFCDDGSILVKNFISENNSYIGYFYKDGYLITQEYENASANGKPISEKVEKKMDKETFIAIYEKKEYSKFNLNLLNSTYYREKTEGMDFTDWYHYFKYNDKFTFNCELLGKKVSLKNYYIKFYTGEEENSFKKNNSIQIIGTENSIEYTISIHIDKDEIEK